MTPGEPSYRAVNREGWDELARAGCEASRPWGAAQLRNASAWLDAAGWIPWPEVKRVLCLGAGGGQQAPLFAALGCRVTSVDLSAEQLRLDAEVARCHGLEIECVEADMLDLGLLYGSDFDLVYQAVSACYVPDVRQLYLEVSRVLRPGGWYRVEHWNPVQIQLAEGGAWSGRDYRIVHPQRSDRPVVWSGQARAEGTPTCWHYVHPLHDLIGGLCDAGFEVLRCEESVAGDPAAEPGSQQHLAAYLPPFFSLFARWQPRAPSVAPQPPARRQRPARAAASSRRRKAPAPLPALRRPHTSYVICTLPRSGSWLLSESLEATGIAGSPREYFNEVTEEERFRKWGISSYADYLPRMLDLGSTPNGVFGVKCHWYQFAQLPAKLGQVPGCEGLEAPALLAELFPGLRYIWLTRRDKARQAVSLYRARRTGQWWRIADYQPFRPAAASAAPGAPAAQPMEFDFAAIERLERIAVEQEAKWQEHFDRAGVEPLVVAYEDLVDSFVPQVRRVLRFLDVPVPEGLRIETRLRRQADALSEEWVERYVGMQRARRAVSPPGSAPAPAP